MLAAGSLVQYLCSQSPTWPKGNPTPIGRIVLVDSTRVGDLPYLVKWLTGSVKGLRYWEHDFEVEPITDPAQIALLELGGLEE